MNDVFALNNYTTRAPQRNIWLAPKWFGGTADQAKHACGTNYRVARADELALILNTALVHPDKQPLFAEISDRLHNGGATFLSASRIYQYACTDGSGWARGHLPVDEMRPLAAWLIHHPYNTFTFANAARHDYFAVSNVPELLAEIAAKTGKSLEILTPASGPTIQKEGIVTIQPSLRTIHASTLTDKHASGINILIKKNLDEWFDI
ncbi:MAG TPA: hypothetical protein VK158_06310 [Acidobacteriota bacterium]|nr:hypothetical protein [Acidobacteriota bacterium]